MGKSSRISTKPRSQTLPSSPTHSSSSSDFEFTVSVSPRKSTTNLIPADQLFYKGQLLPLHLSPRLSMVRTLLLASSSTSSHSSDTTATTASRDSTGSSHSTDSSNSFSSDILLLPDSRDSSSRPSSVTDDDNHNHHHQHNPHAFPPRPISATAIHHNKKPKYFSLSRFSSVFRKEPKITTTTTSAAAATSHNQTPNFPSGSSVKRVSSTAKDVIRKYLKKVKPLYDKFSQKQGNNTFSRVPTNSNSNSSGKENATTNPRSKDNSGGTVSHSFSGNLRYPRRKSCISSCPSSMRSSPSHSGVLSRSGITLMSKQFGGGGAGGSGGASTSYSSETSSMEELQSAIQGAIAHCKNSMNVQCNNNNENKRMVSNEI